MRRRVSVYWSVILDGAASGLALSGAPCWSAGYYLVDVLAGITIAIASLAVVGRCATRPLVT